MIYRFLLLSFAVMFVLPIYSGDSEKKIKLSEHNPFHIIDLGLSDEEKAVLAGMQVQSDEITGEYSFGVSHHFHRSLDRCIKEEKCYESDLNNNKVRGWHR